MNEGEPIQLQELDLDSWPETALDRLTRIVKLLKKHDDELNKGGRRFIGRALFAAYIDCRDAGLEQEAKIIIAGNGQVPEFLQEDSPQSKIVRFPHDHGPSLGPVVTLDEGV